MLPDYAMCLCHFAVICCGARRWLVFGTITEDPSCASLTRPCRTQAPVQIDLVSTAQECVMLQVQSYPHQALPWSPALVRSCPVAAAWVRSATIAGGLPDYKNGAKPCKRTPSNHSKQASQGFNSSRPTQKAYSLRASPPGTHPHGALQEHGHGKEYHRHQHDHRQHRPGCHREQEALMPRRPLGTQQ
jgi:hypothetical protein